jgi:hypothetical protein
MSSTQSSFLDSLASAARENPLAAALIGGGALWLLIGEKKLKGAASFATTVASSAADAGTRNLREAASRFQTTAAPPTAPEIDHEGGSFRVGETLRQAGTAASDAISGATNKVSDRFDEGVAYAQENLARFGNQLPGKEAFTKAQLSLTDVLERQPLVLGVVGLAVGAAVAGAFRTSDLENEWVGELSEDVKSDLNERVGAVTRSLREGSDTLRAELCDTGAEAVDRVKQAGMDAADAVRKETKSS